MIQPEHMTSLEKVCPACHGDGYIFRGMDSKTETCDDCDGRGFVPNDLGRDILKFLARYK